MDTTDHAPQVPASVLLVTADPRMKRAIVRTLRRTGLPVETATDGMEALRCLAACCPSLLMLDVNLYDVTSAVLAAAARAAFGDRIRLLALVTSGDAAEWTRRLGVDASCCVATNLSALSTTVQALIQRRQAEDSRAPTADA